jgi:hypothetical protein
MLKFRRAGSCLPACLPAFLEGWGRKGDRSIYDVNHGGHRLAWWAAALARLPSSAFRVEFQVGSGSNSTKRTNKGTCPLLFSRQHPRSVSASRDRRTRWFQASVVAARPVVPPNVSGRSKQDVLIG